MDEYVGFPFTVEMTVKGNTRSEAYASLHKILEATPEISWFFSSHDTVSYFQTNSVNYGRDSELHG